MSAPRAIAIGFEGVVVGSGTILAAIARATLASYGRSAPRLPASPIVPVSLPELARTIAAELGQPALTEQLEHRLERQLQAQLACDAHLLPGAIPLLRRLRQEAPLALTSGCPEAVLAGSLARAGIAGFFATVVGEAGLRLGPPSPAVHREATRRLAIPSEEFLAIEGTAAGRDAARAAGMAVISPLAAAANGNDFPALEQTRKGSA